MRNTVDERFDILFTPDAWPEEGATIDLDDVEPLTGEERATMKFRFPEVERSGRDVVTIENITKRYGAQTVYDGLSARCQAYLHEAIEFLDQVENEFAGAGGKK